MFAGGPWWKGLGASAPGTPSRRNGILAVAVLAVLLVAGLSLLTPWKLVEARAFDYLSTISPPPPPNDGPVIVAIDEPSLAEIGLQWPWPRDLHGRLVEALRRAGAKAVGLDIIFAEPSTPAADEALVKSLGPDVVLAGDETFIETEQAAQHVRVEPLAIFTATGAATGIASIAPDGDGILRRVPGYGDGFAAELLNAAGRPATVPRNALLQAFGPSRTYPTVSYYQALDPDSFLPENFFRGRIVMVGLSLQNAPTLSQGGADVHASPFTIRTGRLVSGVEIQATVFDNLAHQLFIARPPAWAAILSILLGAGIGVLAVWKSTGWKTLAGAVVAVLALLAGSYMALRYGRVFVAPLAPALAFILVASAQAARDFAAERKLRRGITRAFSQYLSPALVERLARDPTQLRLGGEVRTLTILFCDIRGFTTIAEAMKGDPERLTTLINRLLTPLSDVVMAHGGTIDKYIGDCLMAFWNAPLDDPDHAIHAVEASLEMLAALDRLNAQLQAEVETRGETPIALRIGIGVNTGQCVVGNVGSEQRFDYSALGDAVNLASRLEGASKDLGVPLVIGRATAELVSDRIPLTPLREITVKGRGESTMVYAPAAVSAPVSTAAS
ncbi:adenylate/guanylate cyclase domain-containing protein [Mesorhizobium sp.]|uniref:CHASE2 domain-containing protein n=1 Tax=Mesorhizobium sp. TaxID=1871066 RepID=UPI000FE94164|nr:adenylate/guanylate cyclase domain-containing protein [Mesorhizobium sp.]RWP16700.1 MAG: adenylate/guanylate cyclase domain-containing protein [Mesorhizobium sp.]RWQ26554.1 MAG: adenylate/guanylate cyclase domain-containing protein [Mesorhizobium sp.]